MCRGTKVRDQMLNYMTLGVKIELSRLVNQTGSLNWVWWHMLGKQGQEHCSKFEATLVFIHSEFQASQATQ